MRGYKNFEANPHPGSLRHLVEIGYTENAINENGFPEPTDHVLCKVWAAVTDAGNQHYRSADIMNTEAVVNFTIRYRSDVVPGMWVRFRGKKWFISTLGESTITCSSAAGMTLTGMPSCSASFRRCFRRISACSRITRLRFRSTTTGESIFWPPFGSRWG